MNESLTDGPDPLSNRVGSVQLDREGHRRVPEHLKIGRCDDAAFFRTRFVAHDDADRIGGAPDDKAVIVTGYGPTNAPTAGTLSAILATRELQRRSGLPAIVIVSDLGAWNSRNLDWPVIETYRDRILRFLAAIGFDERRTTLRSHQDLHNLILSGRIAKLLDIADFRENRESLDALYQELGLRGSMLGVMVDGLYTVADILGPLRDGHERVLMVAGIEEHYFADLSKIVLARAAERYPGEIFPSDAAVGALYLDLVPGLRGYPKMSKSIPDSAVHLGEPPGAIRKKIMDITKHNDRTVMKMIQLASDWTAIQLREAEDAYLTRERHQQAWERIKEAYAESLIDYARLWVDTAVHDKKDHQDRRGDESSPR